MKCRREPAWSGFRTSVAAMNDTVHGCRALLIARGRVPWLWKMWSIRTVTVGAVVAVLTIAVPAGGQDTPALTFAHDGTRDGTPREIRSGFFAGDPPSGDPLAARYADTYETFPITVPAGTRHGSLRADISWADPRVNLDLSIYRLDAAGRAINPAVARSAGTGRASEAAVYAPSGTPVPPGRYLVVVDNVCSRDRDQDPRSSTPKPAACGIGQEVPDEDSFTGSVTLGNQIPSVTLEGPDRT